MTKPTTPWTSFNRMKGVPEFYACVTLDGVWEDSSMSFMGAAYNCCQFDGVRPGDMTEIDVLEHIQTKKWSIIHSTILPQMYEAGLIK